MSRKSTSALSRIGLAHKGDEMDLKAFAVEKLRYLDTCRRPQVAGKLVGSPGDGEHHSVPNEVLDEAMALPAFAGPEWDSLRSYPNDPERGRADNAMISTLVHGATLRIICDSLVKGA